MSSARSAVVIVVDRLGAGFLGPYGNTWIDTPQFNRLAAQSLLLENVLADSPELSRVYRSYWRGWHALRAAEVEGGSLPGVLAENGITTALLTDAALVAEHPLAAQFSERHLFASSNPEAHATEIEETHLARLFAAACEQIARASAPGLIWIHARGMDAGWDAPLALREQFADEDDPPPPEFVAPPVARLDANVDPDYVWGITQAYAGQVALLDLCFGALLDAVDHTAWAADTLLIFTSPRGFPLGEHGVVGDLNPGLFGELLHVPCIVRFPAGLAAARRSHALLQPPDVWATLLDWFGCADLVAQSGCHSVVPLASQHQIKCRDRACAVSDSQLAIRTPAWFLRSDGTARNLYVKPDDRWEANDVLSRCGDVADLLETAWEEFRIANNGAQVDSPSGLAPVLVDGLD